MLIVSTWYPSLAVPSVGSFVRADTETIAGAHRVKVIHLAPPEALGGVRQREELDNVIRVPMSTSSPRAIHRAWQAIRPHIAEADIVHSHAFSTLLAFAGHDVQIPWVHTEHWSGVAEPQLLPARERLMLGATGRLLNRPDVVTTVSTYLAERVTKYRNGEMIVVPPTVHPVRILRAPNDPGDVRIVGVGGLVPGKDPLMALATVRELRRRGVPARMEWVGDGPLRAPLEAAIGPDGEMTLLGIQDRQGVSDALDRADVFLLPTRGETLCLSAVEAIAHGRPVVMGDRGGQRDYVRPDNGRLVGARNASAYADAVVDVLSEARVASTVASTIGNRFWPENVLAGYERAYERAHTLRS